MPVIPLRESNLKIFDPHMRSRTQSGDDLKNLHYFGTTEVVTTAHGGQGFERAEDLLEYFDLLTGEESRRLQKCGLIPHVAVGVVPDARPRRAHYEIWKALPEILQRPIVVAIGEVGVWEDNDEQWDLFERQVRIGLKLDSMPMIVTPPKELKITLTYKMMKRLEKWGYPPSRILINYCDERLLENVIQSGFYAGYPVGAASNDPRDAGPFIAEIIDRVGGAEQILLTAALRSGGGDVLGIPKTIVALREVGVEDTSIENMVYANAGRLFGLSGT